MATKGTFSMTGLSDWLEDLARAGQDVDAVVQEVLMEGAAPVLAEMQRLVPVGSAAEGDPHPGNLRNHLAIDGPHQEGNFNYVDVGVIDADAETAIYGNVQEYGSGHNAAQPYIRPAIKKHKSVIKKTLKAVLERYGLST